MTQQHLNSIHFISVSVVALSCTTRMHTCNQIFSLPAPNSFDPSLEKVLALKKKDKITPMFSCDRVAKEMCTNKKMYIVASCTTQFVLDYLLLWLLSMSTTSTYTMKFYWGDLTFERPGHSKMVVRQNFYQNNSALLISFASTCETTDHDETT